MASIGIDLGTTNSVLSHLQGGRAVPVPIDGHTIVPSVVMYDGDRVVVGREARNLELLHPDRTIRSVKRRMGSSHTFAVGDRRLSPEEVSAEILRALKVGAESVLGETVRDVVITVPAYFDDAQRRATLRAGELAGLNVLRLLNEPTGASLCYDQVGAAAEEPHMVLIYDLGGGTFDVSLLEVFRGVREVRATAGNTTLGGDDFDDKLRAFFLEEIKRKERVDLRDDARAMARLRRLSEDVKIKLSSEVAVHVQEQFLGEDNGRAIHLDVTVTRRAFEEMIEALLASTIELAQKALADANVSPELLSRICLVGGSTRIPMVRRLLDAAFPAPVHEEIDPDLAVGLGASIQAGMLGGETVDRVLVDVATHTLGIRVIGRHEHEDDDDAFGPPDTFAPILRRNTVLPATRTEEFYTVVDDQEKLYVEVFQGEASRVSENTPVGSFDYELAAAPAHSPLRVAFAYDLNGVVRVSVSQPGKGAEKTVALSLPDAGDAAQAQAQKVSASIERKAAELLPKLTGARHGELETLARVLGEAKGEARARAEEALLDFFLELEGDDDGTPEQRDEG